MNTLLFGKKGRMTALYLEEVRVPVTQINLLPTQVIRTKTQEKDGYVASVVGFGKKTTKNIKKPLLGQLKDFVKEGTTFRFVREIKGEPTEVSLAAGDIIAVRGISKGKGFAGVVRRFGFHGGPKTHGQSDRHRAPGSIGQTTTPGRVYKGKKMAGRMGGEKVFVKNLKVMLVSEDGKAIFVKGAVPGYPGTLVEIAKN